MSDLFTTSRLHVDDVIARAYKIGKPTGAGFAAVEAPAVERGGGILVHPAPLAAFADEVESSVVHRGLHVFESMLCGTAVPPPPELQDAIAMAPKGASQRMLADWRAEQAACGGCHAAFDPLGLTLENYDAIGRYRAKDAAGEAISAAASIAGTGDLDGPVNNAVELAAKLAKSSKVMGCLVNKAASHAFSRVVDGSQSCRLAAAHERAATTGNFVDVMTAILTSPAFTVRALEANP
jgi:hypothetical protein